MKKLFSILVFNVACNICNAQNLVPNPGFELYTGCPNNQAQLYYTLNWFQPTGGTTDYYHTCSSQNMGIPSNIAGYQYAHSGAAYVGFALVGNLPNYREYIEVQLLSPLLADHCYLLQFYINLGNIYQYTTDAIGAYFSDTMITYPSFGGVLSFTPQISNTAGNYPDTLNWTLVSGTFTATGGERYMIIGNFRDDANSTLVMVNPTASAALSYVYMDDVSLVVCGPAAVQNQSYDDAVSVYPNPVMEKLNVVLNDNEPTEIILYDLISGKLISEPFINSVSLNTSTLSKGIYIYEIRSKNGVIKKGKIIKE